MTISRRDFLKIIAVGGAAGLTIPLALDAWTPDDVISETRLLMGTVVNLQVVGPDLMAARRAVTACLNRMQELEEVLSRFKPESQLAQLNRDGRFADAHPALMGLVDQSTELSRLTGGAFDITVKPLLDLYQASSGVLPSPRQIEAALKLVGYEKIETCGRSIAFLKTGMSITLDGIAKGFIVDEGVSVLRELGFLNVMVEAGGDLMGLGEKSTDSSWKIGLQSPRAEMGNLMTTFRLQDQAIATSGDYMQSFTPDFQHHHIIDPRMGHSSPEFASVSVIAPTTVLADGLATAVMVMGRSGLELLEGLPGCELYAVTKDLAILKTSGFPAEKGGSQPS